MGGTAELLTSRFSTSPSADSCDWTMRDSPRSISSDPINPAQSAVDEAGAVFVSLHSHNRVERYDPSTGSLETFARLSAPVTGLAFGPDGALWATGGAVGPGTWLRVAYQPGRDLRGMGADPGRRIHERLHSTHRRANSPGLRERDGAGAGRGPAGTALAGLDRR